MFIGFWKIILYHRNEQGSHLWPPPDYYQQLEKLRAAVGQNIYLVEIKDTAINAGVKISDESLVLLAVIDYPQPDPYRQLCPHMLILDDGRGINLGRIARLSVNTAFGPADSDVLYQNQEFATGVLFKPRGLSRESIAKTSRAIFSYMLGDEPGRLLRGATMEHETTKGLADGDADGETNHATNSRLPKQKNQ